jgi:hypothetical protein
MWIVDRRNAMFQAPLDLPPGKAERISELRARIKLVKGLEDAVSERLVPGPRGEAVTVREARERAAEYRVNIDSEVAGGSRRHHRVSRLSRIVVYALVAVIDFPIMLFVTSSVFNVDWSALL